MCYYLNKGGEFMINCDNYLCVYWKNDKCICDDIELDVSGLCSSCVYFIENDDKLNKLREKTLKKYEYEE